MSFAREVLRLARWAMRAGLPKTGRLGGDIDEDLEGEEEVKVVLALGGEPVVLPQTTAPRYDFTAEYVSSDSRMSSMLVCVDLPWPGGSPMSTASLVMRSCS